MSSANDIANNDVLYCNQLDNIITSKKDINKKIPVTKKVNKGGRPLKKITFKKERVEVLQSLFIILGITNTSNRFYLYDIENDSGKIDKIMALKDDIKKYFNAGGWAIFSKDDVLRPYMSLIRSLLKDMDVRFFTVNTKIKRNNTSVNTTAIEII